jgi:hypothetical protein
MIETRPSVVVAPDDPGSRPGVDLDLEVPTSTLRPFPTRRWSARSRRNSTGTRGAGRRQTRFSRSASRQASAGVEPISRCVLVVVALAEMSEPACPLAIPVGHTVQREKRGEAGEPDLVDALELPLRWGVGA